MMNPVLPVSDPPLAGENNLDGKGVVEDNRLFKGSAMTKRGAYAALSYMACAVMLVLFNKAALSSYHFPCVNVMTLFQMVSSTLFLYTLRRKKIISFTAADSDNNVSAFVPLKTLFHTLPLSAAYLLYMLATMASVRGVNVPMYTTLRRTTVAFTMVIEYLLTGQRYTRSIIGSIFLNTTLNSALTQTICGNMKDVFTVGLGWLLFGGLPFDLMNVIGQLFGFFGSGLYAYYKIIGR
ncbi:hypothetical protein IGI04_013650 [Brassica rapa subsp. trilocularis]|uniref:Sugar phosphate transporter domain-containing protein n=1 Tax=Brassica rapa subsp. trilocularis TaxID=1813537 RepID=A0ABQ7NBE6_BRACM|nr:hypothetical protein IGI04_013650 [Brassica rapa subsp. trilocularis]